MEYVYKTLPNGLQIVIVPMQERDSSGVAIWVKTGARHETPKISGVSHYLEHMLFKGTKKRTTRQIKEEIEGVGGMLNAFTGEESTCYFAKLLARHVPVALDVLSDMVIDATLDAKELEKERTVILEEIKMYRDLPAHHVHDLMSELLWPNQPLGRSIAGTDKTVTGLTRSEIVNYKKLHYHPKNILVSVSGPVNAEEVIAQIEGIFSYKSNLPESSFEAAVSKQLKPKTHIYEKKTEQTHLVIGFHGLSRFHPDRYKLGLMNVILGANMSSRLFEEVREKRGLAYEIKSGSSFYHDTGAFSISAGVETKKAPMAIQVILKELKKISKERVKAGELRRAKDYFMSQLCMALEDTLDHLLWAGERVLDKKELPDRNRIQEKIDSVTEKDVQEIAEKIFRQQNLNLAMIGPVDTKMQNQIQKDFSF